MPSFPNCKGVIGFVGALMLEQKDEWGVSRPYMPVEKLADMSCDDHAGAMIAAQ